MKTITVPLALLFGSALICGAIVNGQFAPNYQIAVSAGGDGAPIAWRLNTRTGEIAICSVTLAKPIASAIPNDDPFASILAPKTNVDCTRAAPSKP